MIDVEAFLIKNNIKPYLNRIMIFEYIYNHHTHPTVEEIYSSVKEKNSRLSKMTVYNVLNIFIEAKIIREVTISDRETRYDIKTKDHGHFKCRKCNLIMDFDVDIESIQANGVPIGSIEKRDLFFYGICNKCLNDMNEAGS